MFHQQSDWNLFGANMCPSGGFKETRRGGGGGLGSLSSKELKFILFLLALYTKYCIFDCNSKIIYLYFPKWKQDTIIHNTVFYFCTNGIYFQWNGKCWYFEQNSQSVLFCTATQWGHSSTPHNSSIHPKFTFG